MTTDPDECVRIAEELAKCRAQGNRAYDSVPHDLIDRAVAAVKPKGPWPLTLGPYTFSLDECNDALIDPPCGELSEKEMDRLVVAWLKHRGVDLAALLSEATGGGLLSGRDADAVRAILDNAEAD